MQSLNWEDVRYFLVLARSGSLSAAAKTLGVEHTTVARRVQKLEASAGARLFERLTTGWRLTEAGAALVTHAERVENEAFKFEREVAGTSLTPAQVRISTSPLLAAHVLAPALGDAARAFPDTHIELIADARQANLNRREADIAYRLDRPQNPGLVVRKIGEMRFGLYGAKRYLKGKREADFEFLGHDAILETLPPYQWMRTILGGRRYAFRANDLHALFVATLAGAGLTVLPRFLGDPERSLRCVQACPVTRPVWSVVHEDVRRSARVRDVNAWASTVVAEALAAPSD